MSVNLSLFKIDALEQYGRCENLRIHGIPESKNDQDEEEIKLKIAKLLNFDLQLCEIQRAHRLGKKPPITFQKQDQLFYDSSLTKNEIRFYLQNQTLKMQEFSQIFIMKDLTPLCSKLLQYIKKECQNHFVRVGHTFN